MSLRDDSRKVWNGDGTLQAINAGSLQRIADATEKMAASYDSMRQSRDWAAERADRTQRQLDKAYLRIAALKGVITKMRRKPATGGQQ